MISHKEVIELAIREVESQIVSWKRIFANNKGMCEQVTKDLYLKRNDLMTLYRIETGCDYES